MSSSLLERSRAERPGDLRAAPVRHPWRWVLVFLILVVAAMMVRSFITNPRWEWSYVFSVMNYRPILQGLLVGTLLGTLLAMIVGVTLGVLLAVMRLSSNPVLSTVAAVYTWFFRSVPRYVLLTILGVGVIYLYPHLDLGLPFGQQVSRLLGLDLNTLSPWQIDTRRLSQGIVIGAVGLGLSEAAYMAEIARAGILSVDTGQREAASALGMSSSRTMRRIVLPQAMRVIVPPTGNETIAMVKDTSLLIAVPVGLELFNQATIVANRTYKIMPAYVAATLWYIIVCSVLMVFQSLLERHFGRGFGTVNPKAQRLLDKVGEH
ncbi:MULTISPECIES: amino acid ABC transporter permease [Aestuariimicrobium]|uniref:amino acid ABC transporter permease n=1 Tax=Aestuariimicrobium TaxID=396388 RepID=UPI0003FE1713|nr:MULTISPECIES: amino acid ABC transporter permease [Aestuariimicrobium]CAI9405648.1 hypothetical protein AESSP_01456 [Aestuariimicrobium sp. T2.26MG-19.2B]